MRATYVPNQQVMHVRLSYVKYCGVMTQPGGNRIYGLNSRRFPEISLASLAYTLHVPSPPPCFEPKRQIIVKSYLCSILVVKIRLISSV
jgi:hypothetical protein